MSVVTNSATDKDVRRTLVAAVSRAAHLWAWGCPWQYTIRESTLSNSLSFLPSGDRPVNDTELQVTLPKIAKRLTGGVETQRLPGLAVGIVSDQRLFWCHGLGAADRATGSLLDQHTLFRVASITKTFTTTAILQLRDSGRLSLDDPLQRHIPEFATAQGRGGSVQGVTLRRMMSHHAGLMTEAPLPCWDALEFPTHEQLLKSIARIEVVIPQESAFKYSNLAFGLLGEVVARVSGRPYIEYVTSEILRPLELESTTFEVSDEQRTRLATGYSPGESGEAGKPAPHVALNGLAACGGLYSSVGDLARWIGHQFCSGPDRTDSQVLAGTTIAESHRPQYLEADWSVAYCLGWRANRFGDRVYHGHGGGIYGFASQILFSKPHQLGVICLANVWPYAGLLGLAREVLDLVLAGQTVTAPSQQTAEDSAPPEVHELLGSYTAGPGIVLMVEYRGGSLRLAAVPGSDDFLHVPGTLEVAETPREFIVRGGRGSGETVVFELSDDGDSMQFDLGGFVYRRIAAGGQEKTGAARVE